MKKVLIVLGLLQLAFLVQAQTISLPCAQKYQLDRVCLDSLGILEKFDLFRTYLDESRERSHLIGKDSILVTNAASYPDSDLNADAWTRFLYEQNGVNFYAVYITTKILCDYDSVSLENVAQHEICHIELGHLTRKLTGTLSATEIEFEALMCSLAYLGVDKAKMFLKKFWFGQLPAEESEEKINVLVALLQAIILEKEINSDE